MITNFLTDRQVNQEFLDVAVNFSCIIDTVSIMGATEKIRTFFWESKIFRKGVPLSSTQTPSVQYQKPFSSTHPLSSTPKTPHFKTPLSSTTKTPQFNTKTPSVAHPKPLSSTPKTSSVQHNLSSTHSSVQHQRSVTKKPQKGHKAWCGSEGFLVWKWGGCLELRVFGVEPRECVELRGLFCAELTDFGAEKEWPLGVELMCWTEEGVELRGTLPREYS